jgi:hypothetical protein
MLRKTVLVRALSIAFSTAALTMAVTPAAMAQSNTTGGISGRIAPSAGATVSVVGIDNGVKRTVTPDASGQFHLSNMPVGLYNVSLMKDNATVSTSQVEVRIGQDAIATLGVQSVQVTGRRRAIDMTSSNGGSSFTARELAALPIAPQISNIVQLAGGTTRGDSRYGNNAASFGGSGASENAAYVNGFPITNSLFQVGYSSLPFGAIAEAQIITGGYGAEFGRSTGGVINITTKSGTNQWEIGGGVTYAPNSLRAKAKNVYYPNTGAPNNVNKTDGQLLTYNNGNKVEEKMYNVSFGGPLIKDKLFIFFAGETTETNREQTRLTSASTVAGTQGWLVAQSRVPRTITKVDWNITDNQHLDFTHITDESKVEDKYYGFNYATQQRNFVQNGGASYKNFYTNGTLGALSAPQGTNVDIIKYANQVTDDLNFYLLAGRGRTDRTQLPVGYIPGLQPITAPVDSRNPAFPANAYTPSQVQGFTGAILRDNAHDENNGYRADVEWHAFDKHTIRAGIDHNKIDAVNGTSAAGGGTWRYLRSDALGYYVDHNLQVGGSTPSVVLSAAYVEDKIQVTKDLLVTVGVRDESFSNKNGSGQTFVEQKNQIAPRLNVAWDVYGDGSLKAFGTAGRYHLQLPANLAVRFAGASLNTDQFFSYTGVDPVTGAPQGLVAIGGVTSANKEFGQEKDPRQLAAVGLKAHYQDEINLGFEKALTPNYNGGIKFTYRKLQNTIDDYSDTRAIAKKLSGAEATYFSDHWAGALFNPGRDNTFIVPVAADGSVRTVSVTAAEIGFPEDVKRSYTALEFQLEHPMRNGWYGKLNYTWSKSYGNQEGQTKSDNAQADVGFSSSWDFPENMLNSTGYLPNDRTHSIKAYGQYELTNQWSFGANALVQSGRPKSRTCNIPATLDNQGLGLFQYGSVFWLCDGPNNGRGQDGRLPWATVLDLNVIFKPTVAPGLVFKVDVLNVLDKQNPNSIDEAQNVSLAGSTISPTASGVNSYTAPRSVRLSAQYNHKF